MSLSEASQIETMFILVKLAAFAAQFRLWRRLQLQQNLSSTCVSKKVIPMAREEGEF